MTQEELDTLNAHPLRPYSYSQITAMSRGYEVVNPPDWDREATKERRSPGLVETNDSVPNGTYDGLYGWSDPEAHPKQVVYNRSHNGLGADYINSLLSERLMKLIESIEPGVHQFIPYDILSRKDRKTRIDVRYYLHIRAFRSPVDLKRAKLRKRWFRNGTDVEKLNSRLIEMGSDNLIKLEETDFQYLTYTWEPEEGSDIPLSLDHLEGHHLWQDRFFRQFSYISAELRERMKEEKITGLHYKRWKARSQYFPSSGSFQYRLTAPFKTEVSDD